MFGYQPCRKALTMGTIWQAEAIIALAKQILANKDSVEARLALAQGIADCAKAIQAHENSSPYPEPPPRKP